MATTLNKFLEHLHHLLAPPGGDLTDGQLLARFVAARDETAFAALVRRHGPMVLAVCRRLLRHTQDAEDCFQATFMVLARKAATVKHDSVGSWLYAVAYRTSLEARAVNARRRTHERQVEDMPHPEVMPPEAQDWRPWLDQELNRLPEKYRAAIVACDLEGRSRKEAARLLGVAEGTISSRLARGRRLLAKRLAPYGLSLSGGALATALCESAASAQVSAALLSSTVKAAALVAAGELTAVSATSAILMKGVLKSMFVAKLKMVVGAAMIVTALGASGLVYRAAGQSASPVEKRNDGKPLSELERLRHENELLKLNLEVVLEKVRAQESELRALKTKPQDMAFTDVRNLGTSTWQVRDTTTGKKVVVEAKSEADLMQRLQKLRSDLSLWEERARWSERMSQPGRQYITISQAEADQARLQSARFALWSHEMEALLKKLRESGDTESLRKVADALDKALKQLHEQLKKPESGKR